MEKKPPVGRTGKTGRYYKYAIGEVSYVIFGFLILFIIGCAPIEKPTNPYLKAKNGFIKVEGGKIWYGITGEGDNTPLLHLHGGPGGKSNFN